MADSDLDRYLKESRRSHAECRVKNSARRNSLLKKTTGLEAEHKLAAAKWSREQKQLRDQLQHMHVERTKTTIIATMRDGSNSSKAKVKKAAVQKKSSDLHLDPYPVTFGSSPAMRSRSNTLDEKDKRLAAACRGRRESREFEDLHVNTATGNLHPGALSRLRKLAAAGSSSRVGSPRTLSPASPRRRLDSTSSANSGDGDSHWQGNPEAIGSVRRPRKSVEEQDRERLVKMEGRLAANGH